MYEWTRLVTLEKQIKIYTFNTPIKSIKTTDRQSHTVDDSAH